MLHRECLIELKALTSELRRDVTDSGLIKSFREKRIMACFKLYRKVVNRSELVDLLAEVKALVERDDVRKVEAERAKREQDRKDEELRKEQEKVNLARRFVWDRRDKHGESLEFISQNSENSKDVREYAPSSLVREKERKSRLEVAS